MCLDVLRRTLKYVCGYDVRQVVNYTDVDDKTIAGAHAGGRAASRVHGAVDRGVPRGLGAAGHRGAGGDAARDRRGRTCARWAR